MKNLFVILFTLLIAVPSFAQKKKKEKEDPSVFGVDSSYELPKGIKEGKEAPSFTAYTFEGEAITLKDLIAEGPVVVLFYRGEWCPVCNKFLSNLSDSLAFIESAGAKVVAISPQQPAAMEKTQIKSETKVQLLEDRKGKIMEAFDVEFKVTEAYDNKIQLFLNANIAETNMMEEAMLPVPATFIIDRDGVVRFKHLDLNYRVRASALDIKKALDNLETK